MDDVNAPEEVWDDFVKHLNEINQTLMFCPPEVRYDLQRNVIAMIEEMAAQPPIHPQVMQSIHDFAETIVNGYEGAGRVLIGLRRIADQADCPAEEVANIKILGDLDSVFERNARTDHYLLDRQLAGRNCAGELYLTVWGGLVLDYLEKQDTYEYEFGRDAETQVKKGLSVIENDNAAEPELP
ncbi:MAG: hypothetical protein CMH27_10225 [Micavibrio sp.]|nr:hypothetical protein [Micavibrio sp.]|tara:strand:- start:96 stop:644 length:549 start_codon:yes stop_codon:yes gene_type:complete